MSVSENGLRPPFGLFESIWIGKMTLNRDKSSDPDPQCQVCWKLPGGGKALRPVCRCSSARSAGAVNLPKKDPIGTEFSDV